MHLGLPPADESQVPSGPQSNAQGVLQATRNNITIVAIRVSLCFIPIQRNLRCSAGHSCKRVTGIATGPRGIEVAACPGRPLDGRRTRGGSCAGRSRLLWLSVVGNGALVRVLWQQLGCLSHGESVINQRQIQSIIIHVIEYGHVLRVVHLVAAAAAAATERRRSTHRGRPCDCGQRVEVLSAGGDMRLNVVTHALREQHR